MNQNAIKCYVALRKLGMSHAYSKAIAKHMPETSKPALREVCA